MDWLEWSEYARHLLDAADPNTLCSLPTLGMMPEYFEEFSGTLLSVKTGQMGVRQNRANVRNGYTTKWDSPRGWRRLRAVSSLELYVQYRTRSDGAFKYRKFRIGKDNSNVLLHVIPVSDKGLAEWLSIEASLNSTGVLPHGALSQRPKAFEACSGTGKILRHDVPRPLFGDVASPSFGYHQQAEDSMSMSMSMPMSSSSSLTSSSAPVGNSSSATPTDCKQHNVLSSNDMTYNYGPSGQFGMGNDDDDGMMDIVFDAPELISFLKAPEVSASLIHSSTSPYGSNKRLKPLDPASYNPLPAGNEGEREEGETMMDVASPSGGGMLHTSYLDGQIAVQGVPITRVRPLEDAAAARTRLLGRQATHTPLIIPLDFSAPSVDMAEHAAVPQEFGVVGCDADSCDSSSARNMSFLCASTLSSNILGSDEDSSCCSMSVVKTSAPSSNTYFSIGSDISDCGEDMFNLAAPTTSHARF